MGEHLCVSVAMLSVKIMRCVGLLPVILHNEVTQVTLLVGEKLCRVNKECLSTFNWPIYRDSDYTAMIASYHVLT